MRPFAGIGLCAALLGAGCTSMVELPGEFDEPSAHVRGTALKALSFDAVKLVFDLEVENPYPAALPLLGVDLALASGPAAPFLIVDLPLDRSVPARGKTTIQVPAELAFLELQNLLVDLRPGAVVPYTADIGLSLDVPSLGRQRLPLETSGEFPIPAVPAVQVGGIEWTELGLTRAEAVLELAVDNGNSFGIAIESLDFALSLAGREVFRSAIAEELQLAGGSARTLRIPFSMSAVQVAQAGFGVLQGDDASYGLAADLRLGTPYGPLARRIETSGRAPLRH